MSNLRASNTKGEPMTPLYEALRHLFSAARVSSLADRHWKLSSCFTNERHVMTEYVFEDGSRIRADSTGERDEKYQLPCHEFTYYPKPPPGQSEDEP
jgi:hypothetical protein